MEALLSNPRGFCAGVIRAIEIVERALDVHGAPVFVLHEIVHNKHVVEELQERGAVFVEDLGDVPPGAVTIFSAHGVARDTLRSALERSLRVIDATCPLVTKVHRQAQHYYTKGFELVIIGHEGHPEVEGHRGQVDGPVHVISTVEEVESLAVRDPERVAYVTQTTLSVDDTRDVLDALRARFPSIKGPGVQDICYATQNRQNAVRELAEKVDVLLVVGASNSSNSNRLREVGEQCGVASHLIEDASGIDPSWFAPDSRIGVTAGASAPEVLVQGVLARLRELGLEAHAELEGTPEHTVFPMPSIEEFKRLPLDGASVGS